ncbi:MAG: hypothetical protein O3B86_07360, partial [Planctomycetota bacterium]|nr:hypothetical protein [Planctomycetota bacterium]
MLRLRTATLERVVTCAALLNVVSIVVAADHDGDYLFESRIRPVLIEKCFKCHGSEKASSGFRVDSRQSLLKGGELGAAIVPGKPA